MTISHKQTDHVVRMIAELEAGRKVLDVAAAANPDGPKTDQRRSNHMQNAFGG